MNIFKKWAIPKNDKIEFEKFYLYYKNADFTPLIKAFVERLKEVPFEFTKSEQVSGSICFFGGVFTSLLNFGYIVEIEGLFTFALCYMLVDHYLDNKDISSDEKKKTILEIYSFIVEGKISDNILIKAASKRYLELIEKIPNCKKYIVKLFESELEGFKIQKSEKLEREVYRRIAKEKGGYTSACIASIIGLDIEKEPKHFVLGSMIQYIDDLIDIKDDKELGIYTLARYDLENNNLDEYIYEAIEIIDNLPPVYNFFKIILLYGIILGVHDNPGCVGKQLENIISNYDCFTVSKEYLVKWFHQKLYQYIEKKIIFNL